MILNNQEVIDKKEIKNTYKQMTVKTQLLET